MVKCTLCVYTVHSLPWEDGGVWCDTFLLPSYICYTTYVYITNTKILTSWSSEGLSSDILISLSVKKCGTFVLLLTG